MQKIEKVCKPLKRGGLGAAGIPCSITENAHLIGNRLGNEAEVRCTVRKVLKIHVRAGNVKAYVFNARKDTAKALECDNAQKGGGGFKKARGKAILSLFKGWPLPSPQLPCNAP